MCLCIIFNSIHDKVHFAHHFAPRKQSIPQPSTLASTIHTILQPRRLKDTNLHFRPNLVRHCQQSSKMWSQKWLLRSSMFICQPVYQLHMQSSHYERQTLHLATPIKQVLHVLHICRRMQNYLKGLDQRLSVHRNQRY